MNKKKLLTVFAISVMSIVFLAAFRDQPAAPPRRLEILFLGHTNNRGHNSERLADIFTREYFKDGINITFTMSPNDLNEENLSKYDGLIVYANHDTISRSQEKALLEFVRG